MTKSAQIVSAGRDNLENLRYQVATIAARLPAGTAGDAMRYTLVSEGTNKLTEIMRRSTSDLNDVGAEIARIGNQYAELGNQKFANGPKDGTPDNLLDDEEEDGEEADEEDHRRSAEQDVQDALGGDQDAAARVQGVLDGITPGQPLTPEQGSYLSQMQAQQNGMTVEELKTAQERLGEHSDIIGNSWQLMSNEDVSFPQTELKVDALDAPSKTHTGGFDKLPTSVQQAVDSPGAIYSEQMKDIAAIVRDGNPELQTGTQLDRHMIDKADRMMDAPIWEKDPASNGGDLNQRDPYLDGVVSDIFTSAGRDHIAVGEHILSDKGDDFIHDITRHAWADDGAAAGSLFSWTGENTHGPLADLAAGTAEKYAMYIGNHDTELLSLNNHTLGQINPELVQGMAEGLTPYIPNIVGMAEGQMPGFGALDAPDAVENGLMPTAKGVFSVLSTDELASELFNGAAQHHAVLAQERFAEDFKNQVPGLSPQSEHLNDSATLQGLVDAGLHNALMHEKLNGIELEQAVYDAKSQAFDMNKAIAEGLGSQLPGAGSVIGPGVDLFGQAAKESIIGPPPTAAATDANGNYIAPDMPSSVASAQIIGALINQGVEVPGVPPSWILHDADGQARILSYGEVQDLPGSAPSFGEYNRILAEATEQTLGQGFSEDMKGALTYRYNQVSEVLNPQTEQPEPPG